MSANAKTNRYWQTRSKSLSAASDKIEAVRHSKSTIQELKSTKFRHQLAGPLLEVPTDQLCRRIAQMTIEFRCRRIAKGLGENLFGEWFFLHPDAKLL